MSGSGRSPVAWLVLSGARLLQGLVAAVCGYLLLFSLAALFVKYPLVQEARGEDPPSTSEIRGAFHIHSTLSDGQGTPSQIARAAKRAGLQFVVITDHNLGTLSPPTFEHGVLVISGVEVSTWPGHLILVGSARGLDRPEWELDPVWRGQQLGGHTIVAHPVQQLVAWTDAESAARADGMELYSARTSLIEALRNPLTLLLPAAAAYLTNPMHGLMILHRGQPEATEKLLQISAREPKLALCAQDSHGFPPYEIELRAFSLHIPLTGELQGGLPPDAGQASKAVIEAIARGRTYCAFDALGDSRGFAIEGLRGAARRAAVGDGVTIRLPSSAPMEARVQVWGGARLEPDGRKVVFTHPGPVQIEVWAAAPGRLFGRSWKPWIVPSPILVSRPMPERGPEQGNQSPAHKRTEQRPEDQPSRGGTQHREGGLQR
ncbi:MAG TPA: PHP domain-containing protein [Myxococcaceae bacterium]|nr:PHP domain-containing protein [Myxococcaceae bacterium]